MWDGGNDGNEKKKRITTVFVKYRFEQENTYNRVNGIYYIILYYQNEEDVFVVDRALRRL